MKDSDVIYDYLYLFTYSFSDLNETKATSIRN